MNITEIYVDGFRNIKETRLKFVEPIIVLLAPNNFGKSNLLLAIQNGFDLISLQATYAVKYIMNSQNYANCDVGSDLANYTFGVKFTKVNAPDVIYHYQFSLGYSLIDNEGLIHSHGITDEFLTSTKEGENTRYLFKRLKFEDTNCKNEDKVRLFNDVYLTIPGDKKSGNQNYDSFYYLALHKLGGMAIFDNYMNQKDELSTNDHVNDDTRDILEEIATVLTSLTRESIGDIICDEKSDFATPRGLSFNVECMKKRDDENRRKYNINPNSSKLKKTRVYDYFTHKFKELFNDYVVNLHEIGDGQYALNFDLHHNGKKVRSEKINSLSFGTRRVFKLLSQIVANGTPLISLEEIEIGLHPELYGKLVMTLFSVLDNDKYFDETSDERHHEPRLIISSHAPGIVNALGHHLDSIYIAVPNIDNPDDESARFAKLNQRGKQELRDDKYLNYFGSGDIIFGLFSAKILTKEVLEFLEL